MIVDYTRLDEVTPGESALGGGKSSGGGVRDRSDPSYAWRLAK